jgi:hypothetical protein
MRAFGPAAAILPLIVVLAACGSSSGGGADATTLPADAVAGSDASPDSGTADPGPAIDPGTATDPGVAGDPGTTDVPPADPGTATDPGKTDPGSACPATAFPGKTCAEAAACLLQCGDDADWVAKCLAESDDAVDAAVDALATCLDTAGCDALFAAEEVTECASGSCAAAVDACLPAGEGTCKDLWLCRKACPATDAGCPLKCYAQGSAAAREAWIAYKDCLFQVECAEDDTMPNGWPSEKCEGFAGGSCSTPFTNCVPL